MFIYKITNKINGKSYIGQTIRSIRERWENHKTTAKYLKRDTYLYKAIRKYGLENFTIEEIDGANSLSELNYKEFIAIHKNNTLAPNGYNLKEGGGNKTNSEASLIKAVSKRNIKKGGTGKTGIICIETGKKYKTIKQASKETNICKANISSVLRGISDKAQNFTFRYLDDKLNKKYDLVRSKRHIKLKEIAKNLGNKIMCIENYKEYYSIQEAARDLKLSAGNIHQILKGKRKQTKGYTFVYIGEYNGNRRE